MNDSISNPPLLPPAAAGGRTLRDFWSIVLRNRWILVGVPLLAIGLAALVTHLQTPIYESEATIEIHDGERQSGALAELSRVPGLGALGSSVGPSVQTEIALLKSRSVAQAVVDSLALQVALLEPNRPRSAVLEIINAPPATWEAVFDFELQDDSSYVVRTAADGGERARVPTRVHIGESFSLGGTTLALAPALSADSPEHIQVAVQPYRATVNAVQRQLEVTEVMAGTQILSIRYQSPDPVLAAAVPNAVTESFIEYKTRTSRSDARNTIEFLQNQIASYRAQLADIEQALQSFREEGRIINLPVQGAEQVRQLTEVRAKRDQLAAERQSLGSLLERASGTPSYPDGPSPYRQLAAYPTFLSNGAIQTIISTLITLENQRAELLVRRTSASIDVQAIDQRIRELEQQLNNTTRDYLASLDRQIESSDRLLARFDTELQAVPLRELEFARLTREQELLNEVYTSLQTQLKDAEVREASTPAVVRRLDAALVPEQPARPRPLLNLAMAAVIGSMLAVGIIVLREGVDNRVHTQQDVVSVATGRPVLGLIPPSEAAPESRILKRSLRFPAGRNGQVSAGAYAPGPPMRLVTQVAPMSPASEAYRALRTSLTRLRARNNVQVVVITSAMPGEGKSTSSANLAVAYAQQGIRTLLIDGDLRAGTLDQLFAVHREPGLSEVLRSLASVPEVLRTVDVGNAANPLHLLLAGDTPRNPSELLESKRMRELMAVLRQQYEVILCDAPPANLVTDAAILTSYADATLLVTRSGHTSAHALSHAIAQLDQIDIPVAGIVLTDAAEANHPYYAGIGSATGADHGSDGRPDRRGA